MSSTQTPGTVSKSISPPPTHRQRESPPTPDNGASPGAADVQLSAADEHPRQLPKPQPRPRPRPGKGKGGGGGGGKQLTHFICLPLVTPESRAQLHGNLERFKQMVGPSQSDSAAAAAPLEPGDNDERHNETLHNLIPRSAIRPLGALHLTIGVMSLAASDPARASTSTSAPSPRTLPHALSVLHSLDLASLLPRSSPRSPTPLTLSLRGLHSFTRGAQTSMLFARPCDASGRLQALGQAILARFVDAGLVERRGAQGGARARRGKNSGDEAEELKLHATIVNTIYAKAEEHDDDGGGGGHGKGKGKGSRKKRGKLMFDAVEVMRVFNEEGGGSGSGVGEGEFVWAEGIVVDRVVICEMGAKKVEEGDLGMEYVRVGEKMIFEEEGEGKGEIAKE